MPPDSPKGTVLLVIRGKPYEKWRNLAFCLAFKQLLYALLPYPMQKQIMGTGQFAQFHSFAHDCWQHVFMV
jgi:hypothetical protein